MSSRVALRGSYRQHSLRATRIGRPQPQDRMEVTLVLRRKQSAPHPWAADRYHTHEELAENFGADPADIAAIEAIASERHLSIANIENVDPATVITQLNSATTQLQASYSAISDLQHLSLVNFLR